MKINVAPMRTALEVMKEKMADIGIPIIQLSLEGDDLIVSVQGKKHGHIRVYANFLLDKEECFASIPFNDEGQ